MTTLVRRDQWGARPPRSRSGISGVDGSKLHYNGPAIRLDSHDKCDAAVRGIQRFHMDTRGWADIAYTLLVCPHGTVYEGRGVGARTAANGTNQCNSNYYAVMALLGDGQEPTMAMKRGMLWAVEYLRDNGAGQHVGPHSSCKATSCPGDPIRRWTVAGMPVDGEPPNPQPPEEDDLKPEERQMLEELHSAVQRIEKWEGNGPTSVPHGMSKLHEVWMTNRQLVILVSELKDLVKKQESGELTAEAVVRLMGETLARVQEVE